MRSIWFSLTPRGQVFVLVGLVATITSVAIGKPGLVWIGALLFLLPFAAHLVLRRTKLAITCARDIEPPRVALGERLIGRLRLTKSGRWPVGLLQFEEVVPATLGRRPRFAVHRFTGAWQRDITYPLLGSERGHYTVGPMTLRAADPFGLAELHSLFAGVNEVLVTPAIHPLMALTEVGGGGTSGETAAQRLGRMGPDDVLIREYRPGDDVRRVHWRASARWNELMVRREEQAWESSALVLLDNRAGHHGGSGKNSSFEWGVSAAASLCNHFAGAGFRLKLADAQTQLVNGDAADPDATREATLLALTDIDLCDAVSLKHSLTSSLGNREGEFIVVICGALTPDDLEALGRARRTRSQGFLFLLAPDSFAATTTVEDVERRRVITQRLREQRWRVVEVTADMTVPQAWQRLERIAAQ